MMAATTRSGTAQPGEPSNNRNSPSRHNPLVDDDNAPGFQSAGGSGDGAFQAGDNDDQGQDRPEADPGMQLTGQLKSTEQRQYTQASQQVLALQRELDKIKHDLAAAQRAITALIENVPVNETLENSSGREETPLRRQRKPTAFSMREQAALAPPTAAQQEAAAVRYLSFVEDMAKLGRKRAQLKFPALTGMANYRVWAQNVRHLMKQNLLEQIIEGQAGGLPIDHPQYYYLQLLKGDAQLMIANAVSARINKNLSFSEDPEPERIWKSLKDQYETEEVFTAQEGATAIKKMVRSKQH